MSQSSNNPMENIHLQQGDYNHGMEIMDTGKTVQIRVKRGMSKREQESHSKETRKTEILKTGHKLTGQLHALLNSETDY